MTYEDEIDAIFRRTQQTINTDRIKNKSQLKKAVKQHKESNNNQGGWSSSLNNLVWDRIQKERDLGAELYINKAVQQAKTIVIGMNNAATKLFSAVFNKKSGSAQVVARDAKTGRFTSFKEKEVKRVLAKGRK